MNRIIAFLTLASLATSAHAAIILVDTGFANTNGSGAGTASLSKSGLVYSHSYDAGASFDTLVVTVSREAAVSTAPFSVTYGSAAMNKAIGGTSGSGVSIFYLDTTASSGTIVLDFTGFGSVNGVGIGIAAIKSDNGDPIGLNLNGAKSGTGTSISIDTADDSFTMWGIDTNTGAFSDLPAVQIVKNTDIGSNGYAAAYEEIATGAVGDTYSYTNTVSPRGIAAANFVVVPEPGAALLGGLGLLCLLRRRR